MTDPERLQQVALALADAISAREEGRLVKLPVLQRADAAGLVELMHAELDDAIARRDAQIGARMACHKGCTACCRVAVVVTEGEAVAVAEWLRVHADARARFATAYGTWRATLGELVEQAGKQHDTAAAHAWNREVQQRRAMCAFNHEGACTIYPVRPAVCRKAHALDTNAHCDSTSEQLEYFAHPETEELDEAQGPMRVALHGALQRPAHFDLLCASVHRLLATAAAGRNDPCPCGSGKKHKKCCGA